MFPSANMTAVPPLPPDIQAQQQASAVPAFMQMGQAGGGMADPVALLEAKVAELEGWAEQAATLTNAVNPALTTLLVPIAQAGKALQSEIANLKQRTAGPSPMVQGSAPPNVPGNIPGARPAM